MPADITELLLAHGGGDAAALGRLVPLVYDDLAASPAASSAGAAPATRSHPLR